jgi:hypothetical protein
MLPARRVRCNTTAVIQNPSAADVVFEKRSWRLAHASGADVACRRVFYSVLLAEVACFARKVREAVGAVAAARAVDAACKTHTVATLPL